MSIELVAPAGSPEALDAAIGEGADAVYLGLRDPNARTQSASFAYPQFEAALRSLRRMGKKLYVTVNTVFVQREADRVYQLLKYLSTVGPDALIVQDLGVVAMIRSQFPGLKIHASTRMNIASGRGANALSRHGVSRVALARELSLEELRSLRAETNMELEVFVHGSLCISASGLCLFSSYLGGKSDNRGICTQACRRPYHRGEENDALESGYYFSPADLQLLGRLGDLAGAGVNAMKIEGRTKSAHYVGTAVAAYRLVLDAIATGDDETIRQGIVQGQDILRGDFARSKTTFYLDAAVAHGHAENYVDWLNPAQDGGTGISLGPILKTQGRGEEKRGFVSASADAAGIRPGAGDSIRLHRSGDSERVTHKVSHATAENGGCWLSIPAGFGKGDQVYLIQTRATAKRYRPVVARNASAKSRSPGFDKAPLPTLPEKAAKNATAFPEGLYVAVSRIEDLYVVQSSRPARVMLDLSHKTARYLLAEGKKPLPFKPADIILTLDPYFPQADAAPLTEATVLAETIDSLIDRGYRQFVANNLGHFSLFRDHRSHVQIIAGPWLYMFNSWAFSFVASLGVNGFVSPFENNRQNLDKTLHAENRQFHALRPLVFIPVFAWPSLFRIRADLGRTYDFNSFSDSRDENFSLICGPEGSRVIPRKPFSITDKIPFLKEAGFRRFVIDLCGPPLKKSNYRDLMRAVNAGTPLPRVSRFNWKDGFYSKEESGTKERTDNKQQRP